MPWESAGFGVQAWSYPHAANRLDSDEHRSRSLSGGRAGCGRRRDLGVRRRLTCQANNHDMAVASTTITISHGPMSVRSLGRMRPYLNKYRLELTANPTGKPIRAEGRQPQCGQVRAKNETDSPQSWQPISSWRPAVPTVT